MRGGWRATAAWLSLVPALVQAVPLLWKTPLSHDHPAHLFKAWHFWTEMLAQGRLRGWSHFWGFGFPSDEFVPSGGELWVSVFRALGSAPCPRCGSCRRSGPRCSGLLSPPPLFPF